MGIIRETREIPLSELEIGTGQARLRHVDKDIDELAESIRVVGLLEPIVVCENDKGKFEIITGQRRFLAHVKLQKPTILAGILNERVDENTAKILSVTENLIRLDLDSRDLIDVCTLLYKRYGSIKSVVEETGLPINKVSSYVKYDRLIPELRDLVDNGEVKLKTALRAQDAASVAGPTSKSEAIEFAKEMESMSGAQQSKIVKNRQQEPNKPSDEVIEDARKGGRITQIQISLSSEAHDSLKKYADYEQTTIPDAARLLIQDGLGKSGFMEGN